jgi:hypothetical protein
MYIGLNNLGLTGLNNKFSPAALFSAGEQGAWYDPSDMSSMYQDSKGTTPVTAVGQTVGLMLDKRLRLTLGSDMLAGETWTTLAGGPYETFTSSGSTITSAIDTNNSSYAYTTKVDMVLGTWYRLDINLTLNSGTGPKISTGDNGSTNNAGSLSDTQLVNGANVVHFQFNSATHDYIWFANSATGNWSATLTLKSIAGNHLTQATSAARPVLKALYNKLTKTEQFDDAAWLKGNTTVTANADGSADKIIPTVGVGLHTVSQTVLTVGVPATVRARAKPDGYSWLAIQIGNVSSAYFNVSAGTLGTKTDGTYSITAAADGYYDCVFSATPSGGGSATLYIAPADSTPSYAGDGTSGLLVAHADARLAADAALSIPAYQRVNTTSDYDSNGFYPYLEFDGVDDVMEGAVTAWGGIPADIVTAIRSDNDAIGFIGNIFDSNTRAWLLGSEAVTDYRVYNVSGGFSVAGRVRGDTLVLSGYYNAASSFGQINNTTAVVGTVGAASIPSAVYLGAFNSPFQQSFVGRFFGAVLRGGTLTTGQRTQVKSFLGSKCGLAI